MLRFGVLIASLFLAGFALADDCTKCADANSDKECASAQTVTADMPPSANRVKTLAWDKELASEPDVRERAFWATSAAMLMTSEAGKEPKPMVCAPKEALMAKTAGECEKSTPEKKVVKGGEGCCNKKGESAKFKVWAGGGYHFFGCEDSAKSGHKELTMKGLVAGGVQPVLSKQVIN
jgi:hypothetical protein